jgi:hypothetical protein
MDYPQFLMACVDEHSEREYLIWDAQSNESMLDHVVADHDSMMIDIECVNYINHDEEKCASYMHLQNDPFSSFGLELKVCDCKYPTQYCGPNCSNV